MPRTRLRDDQWERIKDVLPWQRHRLRDDGQGQSPVYRGGVVDCADRQSVARLSPRLRELWHATYTRCSRWGKKGVWQRIITTIRHDAELEALLIDSTVVRAHQHAAGAPKKTARKHSGARGAG